MSMCLTVLALGRSQLQLIMCVECSSVPKVQLKCMVNQKVQMQTNSNDCGLFAMAASADICDGLNPMESSYEA